MLHKKQVVSNYHIVIPVTLLTLLTVGVFITVFQTQENQNLYSHAATTNCTISSTQLTVKSEEQILFGEINMYRVQHNVDHLIWDNTLKQSSAWQSSDMLAHNTLSHTDSLGRTPDIRLANCGYDINNGYGENIANGTTDPSTVFDAWKNDPPHNQILLDPRYNIAAIDMETKSGRAYWTMDLGASSPINNPAPTSITISPGVFPTGSRPTVNPIITFGVSHSPSNFPSMSQSPNISPNPSIPSATPAPVATDMQIFVKVKIYGIGQGGNTNPQHLTRKITAIVYGPGVEPVTSGTGYLVYDKSNYFAGVIHLGLLNQGAYFVKLVGDNTLQVLAKPEFQNLLVNQVNNIPPVLLYQGDMNGDNVLDINDYNLVLPCFQTIQTCGNANLIDFNDDGKTDVADYNLFLQSFEVLQGN